MVKHKHIILLLILLLIIIFLIFWYYWKRKKEAIVFSVLRGPNQWSLHPIIITRMKVDIIQVHQLLKRIGYSTNDYGTLKNGDVWFHYDIHNEEIGKKALEMVYNDKVQLPLLTQLHNETKLGISTNMIVDVAKHYKLPITRMNKNNFLMFGYGSQQKRIMASITHHTKQISVDIAQSKHLTKLLLRKVGVPIPHGGIVPTANEAWKGLCQVPYHVVIKPLDSHQGKGITINPKTQQEVEHAFELAKQYSDDVIMEETIEGNDYRVLVVNGNMMAVAKRSPPIVIGDGISSIQQLIQRLNQDPLRQHEHNGMLTLVTIDDDLVHEIKKQGFQDIQCIPAHQQRVSLRQQANLSMGGTATFEDLDNIHPENKRLFILTSKVIGLDITGIDVLSKDLSIPLTIQGAVIEVNAAPGLRMHLMRNSIGKSIIRYLYPTLRQSPVIPIIPIIAITGVNGKTTTTFLISHILKQVYNCVGSATTNGIYFNNELIRSGDCSGPQSTRAILQHPKVDVAVLEVARGGIIRSGLGFQESSVGVLLNIGQGDHLGIDGIETIDDLFRVKSTVLKSIQKDGYGIVNANDEYIRSHVPFSSCASNLIWYSMDPSKIPPDSKRFVTLHNNVMMVIENQKKVVFQMNVTDAPFTQDGRIRFNIDNMLATVAVCWSQNVEWNMVRKGLETFETPIGRSNFIPYHEGWVIIDYAHNVDAIANIVKSLPPSKRTFIMFGAAGDRRNEDIIQMVKKLSEHCEDLLLFEDKGLTRGRIHGHLLQLMERTAKEHKPKGCKVHVFHSEEKAVDTGLTMFKKGNVGLFLLDDVQKYYTKITNFVKKSL